MQVLPLLIDCRPLTDTNNVVHTFSSVLLLNFGSLVCYVSASHVCMTVFCVCVLYIILVVVVYGLKAQSIDYICLQCFDAVGWAAGRASSL